MELTEDYLAQVASFRLPYLIWRPDLAKPTSELWWDISARLKENPSFFTTVHIDGPGGEQLNSFIAELKFELDCDPLPIRLVRWDKVVWQHRQMEEFGAGLQAFKDAAGSLYTLISEISPNNVEERRFRDEQEARLELEEV